LELSPHDEEADGEGAVELHEPEELPAVEEEDGSRLEESVAEAGETDSGLDQARRESDALEESEAVPVPTLTEESRELAEDRTLAPPARYKGRRPSAIHKGVPVYDEEDFLYELGREISRCERVGRPLTLILIRVSDLDQIVEMFGGGFRRQVLWHVAEQALESLREVDLAGQLSSEEVVGLIAFASGRYGGRRIVSRVKRTVRHNPFNVGEGIPAIVPALRFGMATFPKEAQDMEGLLDRAHRDLSS
jgi:diguanylate cyclase (GGDEF)-like protein